jgi:hypothetical protein
MRHWQFDCDDGRVALPRREGYCLTSLLEEPNLRQNGNKNVSYKHIRSTQNLKRTGHTETEWLVQVAPPSDIAVPLEVMLSLNADEELKDGLLQKFKCVVSERI